MSLISLPSPHPDRPTHSVFQVSPLPWDVPSQPGKTSNAQVSFVIQAHGLDCSLAARHCLGEIKTHCNSLPCPSRKTKTEQKQKRGSFLQIPMFYSEKPEFPASVLFGLCLGLALWGGGEHLVGVRQSRTLPAVQGAQSLHQGLQLVLLQLEVQLHTVAHTHRDTTFSSMFI